MPQRNHQRRISGRDKPVRYAVLGLGHIAQVAVLPAFRAASRNSTLAALVSDDSAKLERLGRLYRAANLCHYEALDELFASGAIDAVYIALPNSLHRDLAVRAAQAGLHVLCEKPLAVTVRECEQMIRAARANRVKLMTAYRLHFEPANVEAAQLVRSGQLGTPRYFSSEFSMQVAPGDIRLKQELGGGPLHDIGIYCINAARAAFAAEPVEVWATATRGSDLRFREVPESVAAAMRFKGERLATFTCSFGTAGRSTYTVVGTKGSITVEPAFQYAQGLGYMVRRGESSLRKRHPRSNQFAAELLHFSDCVLTGREPGPSGEEGLADVRVIEAMLRSIRTGRWVKLRPGLRRQPAARSRR